MTGWAYDGYLKACLACEVMPSHLMLALHVHSLSLHVADSEQDDVRSQELKQCTEVSHDQKCHHMDEASSNTSSMHLIRYTILALYKFICMYVMPFTLLHESTSHETCHLITESFPKLTHNIYYPVSRLQGLMAKKCKIPKALVAD